MQHQSDQMQACIQEYLKCHTVCLSMAMSHCLTVGGRHVEPGHFRLMLACATMCETSANMMMIGTDLHRKSCALCAEICDACAASCEAVGDMDECVAQCRACAETCRRMAA